MEKTTTMNLRVNPNLKRQAEDVLKQLGVPMATAVDMYLRQIVLTGGIPFPISLPKVPPSINDDAVMTGQLIAGPDDMQAGNAMDAATV